MATTPGTQALRRGRYSERGRVYLVTTVTHGRKRLLGDLWRARAVVRALRELQDEHAARTLAFVVMPDHVHWLIELGEAPLSGVVRRFKARSARGINRLRASRAPVWQRGFHDHAARREDNVPAMARYIAMNPVRAGLAGSPGEYAFWDCVWEVEEA